MPRRALLLLAFSAGCLDWEDDVVHFSEDFEDCGLCEWEVAGDVTIVTTNHPGEHAARFGDNGMLRHVLGIQRTATDDPYGDGIGNFTDGNWIEYSTDCAGTPRLALDPLPAGELQVRVRIEGPIGDRFVRRRLMFPPVPIGGEGTDVVFRRLHLEAGAPCRLDNLRLMVSGGTLGY